MAIIHPVGKPVDKCERRVIGHLRENLPDSFHVYHNLELLNDRGHPYEYDLIVFENTLVWVLEVKNYRGTIRGNAVTWELPNRGFDPSPIPLTNTKARILKTQITNFVPLLHHDRFNVKVYVDTLVVLCDNRARVKIKDPQRERVVHLSELVNKMVARRSVSDHSRYAQYVGHAICDMLDHRFGPLTRAPRIGDYEVEDSAFSHGDHSVTYPARHVLLKTRVALKVFRIDPYQKKEKLSKQQTLALRAAKALMLIGEHPNIVRCYPPFPWEADKIVLPLEWVDGPTLRDVLNEGLDWSNPRRLGIFRQICEGLVHSHRHGVYHRSLSPENVVVAKDDQVKLVGFDFAKVVPKGLFMQSSVGTKFLEVADMRYLAPEVIQDPHAASVSSDIFSAGVVLFELMTGSSLFEGPIQESTELQPPSTLVSNCPAEIDEIFLRMCAHQPDERYSSFEDVLFDIQIIS